MRYLNVFLILYMGINFDKTYTKLISRSFYNKKDFDIQTSLY